VPTLTCGLVRSNLPFAIFSTPKKVTDDHCVIRGAHGGNRTRDLSLTKGVLYH
jgi:hypothetical protein